MGRPKGSINGIRKDDPDKQLIEFPNIGVTITLERVLRAKKRYPYKYTLIEYEGKKPIEIIEYFDKNKYYVDKVIKDWINNYQVYKQERIVRDSINKLINFEHNKQVIIKDKNYKVTIWTESRNIVVGNTRGCWLAYLDKPYIYGTHYIISYEDTELDERRYFNE